MPEGPEPLDSESARKVRLKGELKSAEKQKVKGTMHTFGAGPYVLASRYSRKGRPCGLRSLTTRWGDLSNDLLGGRRASSRG